MADAYEPPRDIDGKHIDMKPIPTNTRYACAEVMKKAEAEEPWFGIEQVTLVRINIEHPGLPCTVRQQNCLSLNTPRLLL